MDTLSDIGLIGLAVMGENLVLNMESRGFTVSVFNRSTQKVDDFISGRAKEKKIIGTHSVHELVQSLKCPRKVMLMIKAGNAVDEMINNLIPLLSPGDIIIDGGNTHFPIRIGEQLLSKAKVFFTSVPVFQAVKKEPYLVHQLCLADRKKHGSL